MKLQLELYGKKYIVETDNDDLTIDEHLDVMTGLLYQATFSEKTIERGIIELAESFKNK
jgi:hypothetical protein